LVTTSTESFLKLSITAVEESFLVLSVRTTGFVTGFGMGGFTLVPESLRGAVLSFLVLAVSVFLLVVSILRVPVSRCAETSAENNKASKKKSIRLQFICGKNK
jgi:hypothetical protein